MTENYLLSKVGWLTNIQTIYIPEKSPEEMELLRKQDIEYYHKMYEIKINFLQKKGLTTRVILQEGDLITDESSLFIQDLTEDGFRFYVTGIKEWITKLDKSKNRKEIVTETTFLEKKYKDYIEFELPFFKKLITDIKNDKKTLQNKKKLIPFIDNTISELSDNLKLYFDKRSRKTTIDLMFSLCYIYSNFHLKK